MQHHGRRGASCSARGELCGAARGASRERDGGGVRANLRRGGGEVEGVIGSAGPTAASKILVNSFKGHFGDAYPKGGTRLFACTGFFIDWNESQDRNASTILTSASLVGNSDCSVLDNKIFDGLRVGPLNYCFILVPSKTLLESHCINLQIEVLLPKGQRVEGTLMHYNLHYNVALVSVKNYTAASPAILKRKKLPSEVIAVGRCFESGDLMASRGELVGWSVSLDCDILQYSTCKITKGISLGIVCYICTMESGIGGPLVDDDGNYIGMNFYDPKIGNPALFHDDILRILKGFKKRRYV
ncbi:hypothetical protein EJB05_42905, partial [Eragrostis curvula]